jgi:pimeloyl-ACP methyl ester carboxylesterase
LKVIDPLVNPTAHGGSASDAFHVVIPSMPGYGFSGKPTSTGWNTVRIARAWTVLMKRLGYTKFVAQGGDWGAVVVDQMGVQAPPELLGIHTNMAGVIPADIDKAAQTGAPTPFGLSADETRAYERLSSSMRRALATRTNWGCVRRRFTGFQIPPSAWQPICSTTTRGVWI